MSTAEATAHRLPSEERPWQKYYYPVETISADRPVYEYMRLSYAGDLNAPALHYYGTTITYRDFFEQVDNAADSFVALGVQPGDYVAFVTINLPEALAAFYGLNKLGAIPVLIEPRMGAERIRHFVEMVNARTMIVLDIAYPKVAKIIEELNVERVIVQCPSDSLPFAKRLARNLTAKRQNIPYSDRIITTEQFNRLHSKGHCVAAPYMPGSVCAISQTGGTTGIPKGVQLTNKGLNTVANNFKYLPFFRDHFQRFLNIMPLFTSYGIVCGIHLPLSMGVELLLVPDFKPERFAGLIKKYRPNGTIAVPTFFETWLKSRELRDADLSHLYSMISGGDYMSNELETKLNQYIHSRGAHYPVAQGYGLSETSSAIAFNSGKNSRFGSVGLPLYTSRLGIFKPGTTEELGYNQLGEICIAGDTLMKGYFNNPTETENIMQLHPDGTVWVHSGDLGYIDEDGFLFFKGRTKFVIPRFDGHKVFPSQIENVVLRMAEVENCAVISVKDRDYTHGMLPLVVVKKRADCTDTEEALRAKVLLHCAGILEERGQPCGVVFVEEFPLTLMGKVDIKTLSNQFKDYEYRTLNTTAAARKKIH